jgi:predicted RNA-binding protein YlxR (DUF448 family)
MLYEYCGRSLPSTSGEESSEGSSRGVYIYANTRLCQNAEGKKARAQAIDVQIEKLIISASSSATFI